MDKAAHNILTGDQDSIFTVTPFVPVGSVA